MVMGGKDGMRVIQGMLFARRMTSDAHCVLFRLCCMQRRGTVNSDGISLHRVL